MFCPQLQHSMLGRAILATAYEVETNLALGSPNLAVLLGLMLLTAKSSRKCTPLKNHTSYTCKVNSSKNLEERNKML